MSLAFWNAKQTVNSTTNLDQGRPKITQLTDGTMVVAWEDYSSGNADMKFQRYDAAGVKIGGELPVHLASPSNQQYGDIIALSGGGFVVSYLDVGANVLFAQKFFANGTFNGGPIVLSNPAYQTFAEYAEPPVIQALDNDRFVAVYHGNNIESATSGIDLVGQIVDAAGVPSPFPIANFSANRQFAPAIAVRPGTTDFTVVWTTGTGGATDISMRTFFGVVSSTESQVNSINSTTEDLPAITFLQSGLAVVTWTINNGTQGYDIRGRLVDQLGNTYGAEFQVSGTGTGNQVYSKVLALTDDRFVVVYQDSVGVFGQSFRAQLFNPDGSKAGSELTFTNKGDASFNIPDIVGLADGRVAVVWSDQIADGSNSGVVMQIIDPREGNIVGTANGDKIWGHDGNVDFITGNAGADTIYGLRGNDTLYGDAGKDSLYGGRGDDDVYGGADDDIIYGDFGDDQQFGGDGNDIIYSGAGGDLMDGGAGTGDAAFYVNELLGARINLTDQLLTGGSALGDTLFNFERVYGSVRGANDLTGDNNANILVGGQVNDIMRGGGGADVLRGWGGADTMAGGLNNDIFQYTGNTEGGDIITDFAAGDKFQFVRTAFGNLAGANVAAVNFLSVASGHVATTASQRFIFDQATKQLWYDANGNVAGGDVMIADLSTSYNIVNTDLLLA